MKIREGILWILAGVCLVLLSAIFHVGFYDRLTQRRYSVLQLRNAYQELYHDYARLQAEYELLTSPARLSELSNTLLSLNHATNMMIEPDNPVEVMPRVLRYAQQRINQGDLHD